MGYSEVYCRLCGVTFNIGRRRLRSEPPWMGWSCTGDAKQVSCQVPQCMGSGDENEEDGDGRNENEEELPDCEVDKVEDANGGNEHVDPMMDGEDDEDYEFEEPDEEELELDSEDESSLADEIDEMDIDSDAEDDLYAAFEDFLVSSSTPNPPPKHRCFRGEGYKGEAITAEEMAGCNTAQCLMSKFHLEGAVQEEVDDQDFERGGRYCLSALCGHVRSRDCGGEEFSPKKNGIKPGNVDSIVYDPDTAIPFHPTCFDIFSRLSRKRFGYVNFEVLGDRLYNTTDYDDYDDCRSWSSDKNVGKSHEQWWMHLDGCEYLAANPLLVPRLTQIFDGAIQRDPKFDHRSGAFDAPVCDGKGDVFNCLALELRLEILSYLNSLDIANLRLASRRFRQLPILLWRDLLLREMPWLWEVWSDEPPYPWAIVTHEAAVEYQKTTEEIKAWREKTIEIIQQEMPEIFNDWNAGIQGKLLRRESFLTAAKADTLSKMVTGLPPANTNWYQLYTDITRNWDDLKGLKNRKRIWIDIERLMEQVDTQNGVSDNHGVQT